MKTKLSTGTINIRIPKETKELLLAHFEGKNLSSSRVLRSLIDRYIVEEGLGKIEK